MVESPPPKRSLTQRTSFFDARFGDGLFYWSTLLFSSAVLLLVAWLGWQLYSASAPSIEKFGFNFLTSSVWKSSDDPIAPDSYGAWPYIYGTLMSSLLALLLAVPIGLGTAIYLAELAPKAIRTPLSFLVELLAAVPSVVYGLWGRLVMIPFLLPFQEWLFRAGSKVPVVGKLFSSTPQGGPSMLMGGLILAIMILPFITAVSREVIKAVPRPQREAAFGLGATHWEAIKGPVLRAARSGIIGAIILGLARALGETMAITMVIGNGNDANVSLLSPANTISSKLALQFAEADGLQYTALMYLALVLFGITIVVNAFARLLIWNMARSNGGTMRA